MSSNPPRHSAARSTNSSTGLREAPDAFAEENACYQPRTGELCFGYYDAAASVSGRNLPFGRFYTCLFTAEGHDLRAILRDPALAGDAATEEALAARIAAIWRVRDDRYSDLRTEATSSALSRIEMFAMGG